MARGRKAKNQKMKRANGSGSIKKLSGNRRNPYVVLITKGYEVDEVSLKKKQIQVPLGYYPTEDLAKKALDKYNTNPYDIDKEKITFADVYEEWSKRYYKDLKNKSSIRSNISAFNHSKPLHNMIFKTITITNMKDTINNANVGPATKGRMKSLYNLMYDYAVESEIVDVNTARNFTMKGLLKQIEKEKKIKKTFSEDDEKILWDNQDYGFAKMILIAIYSGWRPQELAILKRDNIDLENDIMIGGLKTEAGTDRIVPIHPKIKDLVKYYYEQSEGQEYLFNDFEGQQGTYMTYDKYRGRFKKVMSKCQLEGYTPHCTRHTFITKAKNCNVDEYALKLIVGHEIRDITEKVYTHRDIESFIKQEMLKIK